MVTEMKKYVRIKKGKVKHEEQRNSLMTLAFAAISVLLQILWFVYVYYELYKVSTFVSIGLSFFALLCALAINGKHTNAAVKMPWIVLILAFPMLGMPLYLTLGRSGATRGMRKRFEEIDNRILHEIPQDGEVVKELREDSISIANQCRYIYKYAHYPVYNDSHIEYYNEATLALQAQLDALKQAKKFIFMEYHAIEDAQSFKDIKKILEEKAAQGVEVRLFYDDIGSAFFINKNFRKRMEKAGIKCRVFNPMVPVLNVFMDNRDHRKITVIDGIVGFTGGYNLADEYFDIVKPYGHWKDTGVKITGNAVKNLTITFLEIWNAINSKDVDDMKYSEFLPDASKLIKQDENLRREWLNSDKGYIQPYADSPLDMEHVGENVYLNVIASANKYIYFMTPYLIITDDMNRALGLAAKRGVDVRIIIPGIPDKKLVYMLTRSYFPSLIRRGVKIYEYKPGFCHAKMCVSDDRIATVGTINLDYRSLYHHFENGVMMYKNKAVIDIKTDFDKMFKNDCKCVNEEFKDVRKTFLNRVGYSILRLFAPLL